MFGPNVLLPSTMTYSWRGQTSLGAGMFRSVNNVDIGSSAYNRRVYVLVGSRSYNATSVTIAGVSATNHVSASSNEFGFRVTIFSAAIPTGNTATIDVAFSSSVSYAHIGVYSVYGALATPLDTSSISGSSAPSDTLATTTGGVVLSICISSPMGGSAVNWIGLTEDLEINTASLEDTLSWASATISSNSLNFMASTSGDLLYTALAAISLNM